MNYEMGMNTWEDSREQVFAHERTRFYILAKSYRNTIEISEYAGKILDRDCASFGEYKITQVILWNPDEKSYGENDAEAKLLYVAVTRALHELHIVYGESLSVLFGTQH